MDLFAKPIDNGFYEISAAKAKALAGGRLPAHGREQLVEHEGKTYWLTLTVHGGKAVWSIRDGGSWKLRGGVAIL